MIHYAGRSLPLPDPLKRCPECGWHDMHWFAHAWRCGVWHRDEDGARVWRAGCGAGISVSAILRGVVHERDGEVVAVDPSSSIWLEVGRPLDALLVQTDALRDASAGTIRLEWIPPDALPRLLAEAEWLDRQDDSLAAYIELLARRAGALAAGAEPR